MWKNSYKDDVLLENVMLNDKINSIDNDFIAIMISDKFGNYVESETNEFPTSDKYTFNSIKSGCIDSSGNQINNEINYSSGVVTFETDLTSYCYLYFDYAYIMDCSGTIGECLVDNPPKGLDVKNSYDGMYRYIGTDVNNYVSLDGILYRIVGVTSEENQILGLNINQIKLIKENSIGNHYWNSVGTENISWENSDMNEYLNGESVLGNTEIIPSDWINKIDSVKWNIGDVLEFENASVIANLESSLVTENNFQIGLMYLSDYYYANNNNGTVNCGYSECFSWLNLNLYEWTMSRYGFIISDNVNRAWMIGSNTGVGQADVIHGFSEIRPVFYLTTEVEYIGGSGSISNPILIS